MQRNKAETSGLSHLAKLAIAFSAFPLLLLAYVTGPDAGYSGVPSEGSCTSCHTGGSGSGSVSVAFPNGLSYSPGVTQHLVVTVADPSQKRWGFQLTARQASSSSTQAGTFTPGPDGYTQVLCSNASFRNQSSSCPASLPLQYIEHTQPGTRLGKTGSATFEFDWTPPASAVGNIVVYVAGNAANGDNSERGDHIYTQKYTLTPASTQTAPTVSVSGAMNAASFQNVISAGSWVAIQGTNLANSTRSWTGNDIVNGALPTQLDGVSVTIDNQPAYVSYISPTQINVQAPASAASGSVSVQVTNNGITSAAGTALMQSASPAFFQWGKYAVATRTDYSLVGPANLFSGVTTAPAKPGDRVILWGTGFGATTPAVPPGIAAPSNQVANVANPVTVSVGGIPATVVSAAITPGAAGLYQIEVQVPDAVADGDQPVVAQVLGLQSPSNVLLRVQR